MHLIFKFSAMMQFLKNSQQSWSVAQL